MKLLITGYPGWLTNRFLETLPDYDTPVTSVRCLVHPSHSLSGPKPFKDFETQPGDLLDSAALERAAQGQETVLHAAGVLHVRRNRDFYRINRDGTERLLEAAVRQGVQKFIYISSNAAQGFCKGPGDELSEDGPCRPESHYGRSKYEAEEIVRAYQKAGKIQTVILRPAMFYGPPVAPRHIGIYKKIQKGFFPVFGSGDYLRSLTYIDNLVQGIRLAMIRPQAVGETFYIADEKIPTLNQILRAMASALGVQVRLVHFPEWMALAANALDNGIAAMDGYWMLPHLIGESQRHIACRITKAKKVLGYQPAVDYQQGYPITIRWCRERGLL